MKKRIVCVCMLAASLFAAAAQNSTEIIETYRRNFARANIGTKYELLQEASKYKDLDMGPLYDTAIQFVISNAGLLRSDASMRDMAILSASMIKQYKYKPAAENVWRLFDVYQDSIVRVPVLQAVGAVAAEDKTVILELNFFIETQVNLFKSGARIDTAVLDGAVIAAGNLGNIDFFPALFAAYTASVSKIITDDAAQAMTKLAGDYSAFLENVIKTGTPPEKVSALDAALRDTSMTKEKRARLAETALNVAVAFQSANQSDMNHIALLRSAASKELMASQWQNASSMAVRNFNDQQGLYKRGQTTKSSFLESIALLGAMGTHEAGLTLSQYLQLLNTETEQGKAADEQVTLAVVNNLGKLGDKVAFDYLLYMGYLQYPEFIKKAARDALQKLRW